MNPKLTNNNSFENAHKCDLTVGYCSGLFHYCHYPWFEKLSSDI